MLGQVLIYWCHLLLSAFPKSAFYCVSRKRIAWKHIPEIERKPQVLALAPPLVNWVLVDSWAHLSRT